MCDSNSENSKMLKGMADLRQKSVFISISAINSWMLF